MPAVAFHIGVNDRAATLVPHDTDETVAAPSVWFDCTFQVVVRLLVAAMLAIFTVRHIRLLKELTSDSLTLLAFLKNKSSNHGSYSHTFTFPSYHVSLWQLQ